MLLCDSSFISVDPLPMLRKPYPSNRPSHQGFVGIVGPSGSGKTYFAFYHYLQRLIFQHQSTKNKCFRFIFQASDARPLIMDEANQSLPQFSLGDGRIVVGSQVSTKPSRNLHG